jgi:hypothetical protein
MVSDQGDDATRTATSAGTTVTVRRWCVMLWKIRQRVRLEVSLEAWDG